jgi:excisionase family DNA binding protein
MRMQTATNPSPHISADTDPWLTLRDGAEHVKTNEATLRREIRRGRLRHARIGGRKCIRIRRSWLDAWLEQTSTPIEVTR